MHCHCGTNNRTTRWTFMDPCKPEVRPGAREGSASPAWLAAPTMNACDTTKVYIWRLDTGCGDHFHKIILILGSHLKSLITVYANYFYDTSVIFSNSIITYREPFIICIGHDRRTNLIGIDWYHWCHLKGYISGVFMSYMKFKPFPLKFQ